jgi:hypothetical protein
VPGAKLASGIATSTRGEVGVHARHDRMRIMADRAPPDG